MNNRTYKCYRCNYNTAILKDLSKHLRKKNKCCKRDEAYIYSDDQILVMSLIPYNRNIHDIKMDEINYLKDSKIMHNNIDILLDIIDEIYVFKIKICKFCSKNFCRLNDLRNHIVINCFHNELIKKNNSNINNTNNIDNISNINNITNNSITNNNITNNTNNIMNNSITNNITNITNIILDIKNPIPFDESWDTSKINDEKKVVILFNKLMYTRLFEELLQNETNLNIIIDKESDRGIVYKNNIDEYTEMKKKDIMNITMEKLKNQLLEMNNDIKSSTLDEYNDFNRKIITKKYIDYCNDKTLQKRVEVCLSDLLDKKKEDAVKVLNFIKNK